MRLALEMYGKTYSVTTEHDDIVADELKEMFSRLLVQAGYPPSVIESAEEDGHWEWRTDERE